MKKHYNSLSLEVITIQSCTTLCASKIKVGEETETGAEQLSKKFWGGSIFDEEEPIDDTMSGL